MPLSTRLHSSPLRVRYAETDASGIAHHSAYLPWLEMGRVDWLRAAGMRYTEIEVSGLSLPVVELQIRYVKAVRFDDALRVRTALTDLRSRSLRFGYEIVTDEANPIQVANASSRHICLSAGGGIVKLPRALRDLADA